MFAGGTGKVAAAMFFFCHTTSLGLVCPLLAIRAVGVEVPAHNFHLRAIRQFDGERVLLLVAPIAVGQNSTSDLLEAVEFGVAEAAGEQPHHLGA